jgi:uncharacterized protein (DUF2147 family)
LAENVMRVILTASIAVIALAGIAAAADPTGEWLVANSEAKIRIDNCNGALWGVVAWEKDPGSTDSHNPNPAERSRPTLGIHVLIAMRPTKPNVWEGQIYNAENGKTYDSRLSLTSPDVLRVEGCVLGFLCGGENWTRVPELPPAAASRTLQQRAAKPDGTDVGSACSGAADVAGAPHKGGLK